MKKILVVDDEQPLRELFQDLLEDEGFAVDTASDGQSAVTKILEGGYDLILLDIIMPNMDGVTVLRKLKNSKVKPGQKNGPIVMLTVLEEKDFVNTCLKLGAKDYIRKSEGTPEDIVGKVRELME